MKTTSILQQNIRRSEFGTDYENKINCLNIGFRQFDFMVIDGEIPKMLVYESYELDNVQNPESLVQTLEKIYQKHDCLGVGFWKKIIVNISTIKQTFIPNQYYSIDNAEAFLKLNASIDTTQETIEQIRLEEQNMTSAFAVSLILKDWLSDRYKQNFTLTHDIASFMKGLIELPARLISNQLYVLLKKDFLYLTAFEDGKIIFSNGFTCQTVSDFIYYLLLVSKELDLNRSETNVHFYGQVDDRSAFYQETQKYFGQTTLGAVPSQVQYIEELNPVAVRSLFELTGAYFLGK